MIDNDAVDRYTDRWTHRKIDVKIDKDRWTVKPILDICRALRLGYKWRLLACSLLLRSLLPNSRPPIPYHKGPRVHACNHPTPATPP